MHPRSKHWHLLDYIMVRRWNLKDVLITRAMRGAQGWTDHRLIRCKLRLNIKPPRRAQHKVPKKLAFSKLVVSEGARQKLDTEFGTADPGTEEDQPIDAKWHTFSTRVHRVSQQVVGNLQKKNQDWFDESDAEILKLVEEYRCSLRRVHSNQQRKDLHQALKKRVRDLKDRWWLLKAQELQLLADTSQTAKFFEALNTVYGPRCKKTAPVYSRDKTENFALHQQS